MASISDKHRNAPNPPKSMGHKLEEQRGELEALRDTVDTLTLVLLMMGGPA